MSRKNRVRTKVQGHVRDAAPADGGKLSHEAFSVAEFSFGDATSVLDGRWLMDVWECSVWGKWYEPPVPREYLAKCLRVNPHHASAITYKRQLLERAFVPHPLLSRAEFSAFVLDWLTFADAYVRPVRNLLGGVLRYERVMSKWTRRGRDDLSQYFYLTPGEVEHAFTPGEVFHLRTPDVNQEIYGVPDYLAALQSALLNESATLFRRRFYNNGAHAGFILYSTDGKLSDQAQKAIVDQLRAVKGNGNFRNLFVHVPEGKEDGLKVVPFNEVAAKDDFLSIKDVSRDDVLAAHRMPPSLIGIVPKSAGGLGDIAKSADVYHRTEVEPIMQALVQLNDWAGDEVIRFAPYEPMATAASASPAPGSAAR
ncbi:phage portal protein [Ottowia sp.]|uniref:phage portal protein n=1 Tax=Ottowia sp. TaxID=1898956 RepID=UPI003A84D653